MDLILAAVGGDEGDGGGGASLDASHVRLQRGDGFAQIHQHPFVGADLRGAKLYYARPGNADFTNADLSDADWSVVPVSYTTVASGLPNLSYSCAAWGDYDNDGFEDLLLYKYGRPELFHNEHGERFAAVGAQNEADAQRLRALGCRAEVIHVTGNAKFDAAAPSTINAVMQVGTVSDTITVEAQVGAIQTETSALGKLVEGKQISDLQLNGRNPLFLSLLKPGVRGVPDPLLPN